MEAKWTYFLLVMLTRNLLVIMGLPHALHNPLDSPSSISRGYGPLINEEKGGRTARLINSKYNLERVFFPGKYNEEGDFPRKRNCLPTFKPSHEMREKIRKAVSSCFSLSIRQTMMFGREVPCDEIRSIITSHLQTPITRKLNRLDNDIIIKKDSEAKEEDAENLEPKQVRPKRSPHILPEIRKTDLDILKDTNTLPSIEDKTSTSSTFLPEEESAEMSTQMPSIEKNDEHNEPKPTKTESNPPKKVNLSIEEKEFEENETQYEINIEDLDGVEELNLITEILGGNLEHDQKVPSVVFFPVLGSKAMFVVDKGKESSYYGEEPLHLPTISKEPVRDFMTHLLLRKLGEYLQSCVIKQMDLVDEADHFQPRLFQDFIRMGFSDANDPDWLFVSSVIQICAKETEGMPDNIRSQVFASQCFEPMIEDFCLLRENDSENEIHEYNLAMDMENSISKRDTTTTLSSVEDNVNNSTPNCTLLSDDEECPSVAMEEFVLVSNTDENNDPDDNDGPQKENDDKIISEKESKDENNDPDDNDNPQKGDIDIKTEPDAEDSTEPEEDTITINPRIRNQGAPLDEKDMRRIYMPDEIGLITTEEPEPGEKDEDGDEIQESKEDDSEEFEYFEIGGSFGFGKPARLDYDY